MNTAPKEKLCSICQEPASRTICDSCREKWGTETGWVQDLISQERHWRLVNRQEARLSPFHISVMDGLYFVDSRISEMPFSGTASQIDKVEDHEDLELLGISAGLTPHEWLTYQLMLAGCSDEDGAAIINAREHKAITASAYRRSLEKVLKKIHAVIEIVE